MSVKFGNRVESNENEMILLRSVDFSIQIPWLMHLKIELSTNLGKSDISNVKADSIRVKTQIDPQHELIQMKLLNWYRRRTVGTGRCQTWGISKQYVFEIRSEFRHKFIKSQCKTVVKNFGAMKELFMVPNWT